MTAGGKGSGRRRENAAAVEANWPFPDRRKDQVGSARRATDGPKPSQVESFSTSPATLETFYVPAGCECCRYDVYIADDVGKVVSDDWWPGDPA